MTGTFKTKTRVYTSPEFFTPITGRKSFIDAAVDFRRGLIENSSMAVLNADLAVKAAMGAGLSSSSASVGQTAQGGSPDSDGKKRVNKGGVPGMDEDEEGYRYMPEATWGPGKVLKLFPSKEERQSSNKVPNFGFVDEEAVLTPEQFVQQMKQKPKIRLSKYKINTRTGEPIEDTEVEFDRMRFGKTFDLNPDTSDEIDENIPEDESGEMQEKSLGSSLKQRMPGGSLIGRAAARFGVIMDELGKMRCPPGTPAANQFTDMTGSNCFGTTPGNIISEAIDLAQRLVPENDPMRSGGFTRGIANFLFDMENGIFGNNVWYHADGTRMKHGEWRKFRAAGGVAKNERWMENGVERVRAELDAQDARMADLYAKLGVDVSDASKETNEHLYETFKKLRESGVITTEIFGKPSPAQVEAMMIARLENMDAHWIARTDDEKKTLLKIEVMRYRELERAHLEAFLDEVIKNPEHMKTITQIRFNPAGHDRASFGLLKGKNADGKLVGSIDIDIPNTMAFQDSMLPNLSPDERLRIWAEGGQSDALRALAVKDFLVNSNSHAGQMMAMVDGGRGLGRHDMKHEIAHSIQAAAIFEHMKRELDARGSLLISRGKDKDPIVITSIDQLTSGHVMTLMTTENFMGIDLEALNNLRSRADVVAFLAGRYIWDVVDKSYGGERRAAEIGAELWALRSAGLIFGPDVDAALEYMDDTVDGAITIDRVVSDSVLVNRIYEDHLDGSTRVREAREARERAAAEAGSADGEFFDADERAAEARMSAAREAYAKEKRAQIKAAKEAAKTMSEEEMIDFLAESTEASDVLNEMLDAADDAGEEPSWMRVMDRDTIDSLTKVVADEWVKRFTVRRSPEAMEKLQNMIDKKRESRGSLSPDKIEERRYREFMEGATERAKDMDLAELVQHYSDWEELATGEGVDGPERARRKQMRDMYRDEYVKRRTEGPDSVSKEDARKEFNSKFKEIRKPKTAAERKKQDRAKPKKFTSHKGKNGAHTFATEERARLLEGATTAEKIAFVEMGSGETDVINMMIGHDEGIAAARAIQRRNTRLKKNGILPDALNQHEASIEEQIENFYIPLVELMDKSSLSQTVEMYIDSDDDAAIALEDLLNGGMPVGSEGIGTGTLVTDKTDFSDGKKIIIRVPEGSRALLPDWSYSSDSDNGEQKILLPPSKLHLVEIREDGTVVLEVGEQKGTEAILREAVELIGPGTGGGDRAYREGLQKKVGKIVDARIAERRKQGMFDPKKNSPIEEERFSTTADTAATGAGFIPDGPPPAPSKIDTDGKPKAQRGLKRRQSSTAMSWIINADSWKQPSQAQDALDEIHGYITGEGAFQGRTNSTGIQVREIMKKAFGTQNISELTEEQKYDLIDLISERMTKAPKDQQRGLSQAKSKIQDHVDISKMVKSNNYSDPYVTSDFDFADIDFTPVTPIRGGRSSADRDDMGTGDFDDDLSPDERRWRMEEMRSRREGPRLSSGADTEELVSISSPQDARRVIDSNLPAAVRTEKEAYTILTELAKMAKEAKALGKDAPNYDFCKVSIPGTNLFCGDSKGIPRKKMPQFSGKPTPGSPADSRPKDKDGGVDGTQDFIKHMKGLGVKIERKEVLASTLRATQNELVGEKVAGMMTNPDFKPEGEPIFVSRDGYVIDGHHRWAAQVGRDLEDGKMGDLPLNVIVVDMDILEVLEEANKFTQEFGIAPKTAGNDAAQNRLSSGAKWGQMPSNNQQLARLLEPSNNDGFNEIFGPPQTREERVTQMAELQSEVMTSLREMFDNVPGAGDSIGLDVTHIDPVLADFIKNSSDEEIYKLVAESAKNLHESFDARPRVRMRQDELDRFAASGRYGREGSFNTERLSSGMVKKGIKARAKERAIEIISERIGKDEDSKEIAEMFLNTVSALKFGPEAALARLAVDLGRRGSRDLAERTVQELLDRGKITDEQAKSILSKLDKIAPDGLPEPLKRGVGRAARATADALDTPDNRDRLNRARNAAGEAAGRAREAVGEGASSVAERGRERLRKLRERDDVGSLPSAPDDVPFGDFDPADAPVGRLSSGRRLDRRVSGSDAGRERIMEGASTTRTRLSSGETPKIDKPKKPFRPRDPDNGPMTGKFIDIFRGVKSYQEMLDRYNEQEVIFFDYETTGFSPTDDRPVQIGAVKMKGGKVIERFNIFVNPDRELSDWSKANLVDADGKPLTNDWLSGQSSVNEGHQQLIDFFGPDALLGGQYTPFDLGFLEESLKNAGIEWTPAGVIDSKALADELLPRWTADGEDGPFVLNPDGTKKASNSLGPLSEYLEVELTAWHTADADSEASAMIVQRILERAAEREDTPKHLLDVDNLPNVVTERKARHKLEMDKYFADMEQYKVDNEAYEASLAGERFSSGAGVKESAKNQIIPDNERAAARKAKELIANGGSNEEIEKAIREAFTGVLVGTKDYIDNSKTNRGNKFNMRIRSVTVTDTEDGRKRIEISGQVLSKHLGEYRANFNEDEIVGSFSRVMYFDKDGAEALHTDVVIRPPVQGFGIATALNARNEEIYKELGISSISLYGNSASGRNGASHWPRNGYYWYDENEKNFFLDALSDDLENTDKKTRDTFKALIEKSRADKFGEGVTPEELLAWDDKGKALVGTEIRYRRDVETSGALSSGSRFSSGETNRNKKVSAEYTRSIFGKLKALQERLGYGTDFEEKVSKEKLDETIKRAVDQAQRDIDYYFGRDIVLPQGAIDYIHKIATMDKFFGSDISGGAEGLWPIQAALMKSSPGVWRKGDPLPPSLALEISRQIHIARGNTEMVAKIDEFKNYIKTATPEQLSEDIRAASLAYGQSIEKRVLVRTKSKNIQSFIKGNRTILTQHDQAERDATGIESTNRMGDSITTGARRKVEGNILGLPFQEGVADSPEVRELRPTSGYVTTSKTAAARRDKFKKIYGDDTELMYDGPAGEALEASQNGTWKYGDAHFVLRPEVAERTRVFDADTVDLSMKDNAPLQLSSLGEDGIFLGGARSPIPMLYDYKTGDTYPTPSGAFERSSDTHASGSMAASYKEALVLGRFKPEEVQAIIATPADFRKESGEVAGGRNADNAQNLSLLIDMAQGREELMREHGIEVVPNIGYGIFATNDVEMFNPAMTDVWFEKNFGDRGLSKEEIIPDKSTTPYEAYLRVLIASEELPDIFEYRGPSGKSDEEKDAWRRDALKEELARVVSLKSEGRGGSSSTSGERLSSGETGRSPGLKANRDRPMSEYGMDWKPEYSDKEWVAPAKTWEGWDDVPVTEVDLSSEILPTESHLKGSSIDKVVSGEEAFREGYHPNLIIDTDGKMYVSDGHNRVAMHRALGNEKMTARVIDLRTQDAPWGDKTPNTAKTRLSSGEGPRSGKPKRAKMYKGYTLNEPDNPTPKPGEYPDDVVEAATKQREKIAKVEAEITKLLIDLADKNKAQMEGLDYRMKALKSLMRKIAAEKDSEHGGDAQKAAEAMSDVVRYTMSYEPEDYVAGVKDVIAQMQKLGYELRVKNYWEADDPYQGINVAAIHPNGTKFELQFHTPQSVADKEKIHAIYEDYRTETNYLKRLVMYQKMVNLANKIGIPIPPDELMKIGIVKTQPFTRS